MPRKTRSQDEFDGDREAKALAATLGGELKRSRKRRGMTQRDLAVRIGLEQSRMSEIELGEGARLPLATWVRLGKAIERPFAAGFSRELTPEPRDAGHLDAQELLLGLARETGRIGLFELPTRPTDPARSTDVGIRDDRRRVLIRCEIWNRLDDFGRAIRDTDRKDAEAGNAAEFREPKYRVASCWLFVDNAANRALVAQYPEILRARFAGSSGAWASALSTGADPPRAPGVCWIDPKAGRITALRLSHRPPRG
jgi:transcriptional regulator with XRE-family HTH domain